MDRRVPLGHGRLFLVHAPAFSKPFSEACFFPLADRVGASHMDTYETATLLDRECLFSGPRFFSRGCCEAKSGSCFFQGSAAVPTSIHRSGAEFGAVPTTLLGKSEKAGTVFFRAGAGRDQLRRFRDAVGAHSGDRRKAFGDTRI